MCGVPKSNTIPKLVLPILETPWVPMWNPRCSSQRLRVSSVATAIADVFQKNVISVRRKFMKMLKIFDKIDKKKSQRVI